MKENRLSFADLAFHHRNQVRTLLAIAGGNVNEEIVEVVIVTKPFDHELLRSLPSVPAIDVGGDCPDRSSEVVPSHAPTRTFREDSSGLPPLAPRVRIQR